MTIEEAREKATELINQDKFEMRSCWICNLAHEHLKDHDLIVCFDCGRWFYRGIDITIYDGEDNT